MPVLSKPTPTLVLTAAVPSVHTLADWEMLTNVRDRVRAELRLKIDTKLQELTGKPRTRMRWTEDGYAQQVVLRHKLKIVWPRDIPFMNLSDLRGGVRILYPLRALWEAGSIRLEPATAEDLANAARDPRSVHPNPRLLSERPTPSEGVVVAPLAFRPAGTELGFLGVHPTSTQRAAVVPILGKRPRRQRADIKRARRRPVTNPNDLPLRRRKKGVTSTEYVLDEVSEIEEFSDGDEPAGKRMKFLCTDDPIEEFLN
ncbi:hypothetical protein BN946_scf184691.g2 [Trametes cinnabarina]|uniref:Uncharacterized protein n=1 Tax=Pycnoporus cinnabarinus TaxID=5643 RepID=A0A060SUX0_PYCCI|nr:hypothetical protein BN946_scf184691.g2 [Trametes cinnabarina]